MIYDNIKNIGLYKGLTAALDTALDYIASEGISKEIGTTLLPNGVKAIVSEYVSKESEPRGYEAHVDYADVQFLLDGTEFIKCCPTEKLRVTEPYDAGKDCARYAESPDDEGILLRLGSGYFAVVFPDDAHVPGLATTTPAPVRKLVMKVPVRGMDV